MRPSRMVTSKIYDRRKTARLCKKIKKGNLKALHKLACSCYPQMVKACRSAANDENTFEELVSECYFALLDAAKRYNPKSNATFSTYCRLWIFKYISDHFRRRSLLLKRNGWERIPLEDKEWVCFSEMIDPAKEMEYEERLHIAGMVLDSLPENEQNILYLHLSGRTVRQIATATNMTMKVIELSIPSILAELRHKVSAVLRKYGEGS